MNLNDKKSNDSLKAPLPKPPISGVLINLRPIVKADAHGMFVGVVNDEEGRRLTGTKGTFTFEGTEKYCARLFDSEDRVDYAITLKDNPAYIGEVVLNSIDADARSAGFRIALSDQQYYNKGYGSEATALMLRHGFETLGLHRIELEVYDFNPRAQHVYEKSGFVKEGVRRDVLLWEGVYHNAISMSILEEEWLARHNNKL